MITEEEIRTCFREAINKKEDIYKDEEVEKRDAVSDLLIGFLSQKQIDKIDYKKEMNPQDIAAGKAELAS